MERAVAAAHESLKPRTSKYRATGEYRQHMIGTLLRGTLPLAVEPRPYGRCIRRRGWMG
ncbi:MAG: hypothetical protein LC121_20995 [Anaerolineae bacterium]|nr:hypothetical protein [Anaerolineae bacterium]